MSLSVPAPTRGNFLDTSAHRTPLHQSRDRFRRLRHTIHPAGHLDLGLRRAGPIRRSGPSRGLAAVLPQAARHLYLPRPAPPARPLLGLGPIPETPPRPLLPRPPFDLPRSRPRPPSRASAVGALRGVRTR